MPLPTAATVLRQRRLSPEALYHEELASRSDPEQKRSVLAPYAEYADRPVEFVRDVLGGDPKPYQEEILTACLESPRVAWKAAHGSGKTAVMSWIVIWWLLSRAFSRVIILAPAFERQVGRYLIPEVKLWIRNSPMELPLRCTSTAVEVVGHEREWYALAVQATDSSKVEGAHTKHLAVIADEAKGLSSDIIAALHGTQTDVGGERLFFLASVPGLKKGPFYEIWKNASRLWRRFTTAAWESALISEEWIADRREEWGRESFHYKTRVAAEFAEDISEAMWERAWIDEHRIIDPRKVPEDMERITVAIDPNASSNPEVAAECGIVAAGRAMCDCKVSEGGKEELHGFVFADRSKVATPAQWGARAVRLFWDLSADIIVGERNNGGEMVEHTLRTVDGAENIPYESVWASRGKAIRAQPIASLYEQGKIHHVGMHELLEDQLCNWVEGDKSPDRMDADVWALTDLFPMEKPRKKVAATWG